MVALIKVFIPCPPSKSFVGLAHCPAPMGLGSLPVAPAQEDSPRGDRLTGIVYTKSAAWALDR